MPYLNSYEALKPRISGTPQAAYYIRDDMHLNPAGFALWGEAHVAFLCDTANGLLPSGALAAAGH